MSGPPRHPATVNDVKRMKPSVYATRCGVEKGTVYDWIKRDRLPDGATAVKGPNNRIVIHVDETRHPAMPLYTEA